MTLSDSDIEAIFRAASFLAGQGWHNPVESARKLREAAGRFNVTEGAKP